MYFVFEKKVKNVFGIMVYFLEIKIRMLICFFILFVLKRFYFHGVLFLMIFKNDNKEF